MVQVLIALAVGQLAIDAAKGPGKECVFLCYFTGMLVGGYHFVQQAAYAFACTPAL